MCGHEIEYPLDEEHVPLVTITRDVVAIELGDVLLDAADLLEISRVDVGLHGCGHPPYCKVVVKELCQVLVNERVEGLAASHGFPRLF